MFARFVPLLRTGLAGAVAGGFAVLLVVANRPDLPVPPAPVLASHLASVDWPAETCDPGCGLQPIAADRIVQPLCQACNVLPASCELPVATESPLLDCAGHPDTQCTNQPTRTLGDATAENACRNEEYHDDPVQVAENVQAPLTHHADRASAFTNDTSSLKPPHKLPLPITHAIEAQGLLVQVSSNDQAPLSEVETAADLDAENVGNAASLVASDAPTAMALLEQSLLDEYYPPPASFVEPQALPIVAAAPRRDPRVETAVASQVATLPEAKSGAGVEAARPSTQRCVIRDPKTTDPLATVTIPGRVASSAIDPEELERKRAILRDRRANMRLEKSNEPVAASARAAQARREQTDLNPRMSVYIDANDGRIFVEASNVELSELLNQLSSQAGIPVAHSPSATGVITAKFSANNLTDALQRLLEPFDFVVVDRQGTIVVHRVGEEYSLPRPMTRKPADDAAWQTQIATSDYPLTRFPMLPESGNTGAVEQAAFATPATEPGNRVELLTTADITPPRPQPPTPEQVRAAQLERATEHIAEVAQDAFALDKRDYAVQILTDGVIRYPKSSLLVRLLGEGYLLGGDLKAAEEAFQTAIAIDASDSLAYELLVQTLQKMGQPQRANHYLLQSKMNRSEIR